MRDKLDKHYKLLAESFQTIMRKFEGITDPYEKLKEFTRGRDITQEDYRNFVQSIEGMPQGDKDELKKLTPATYLGYTQFLAKNVNRF